MGTAKELVSVSMSKWKPEVSCVPQGSVLGPGLFNAFMSGMGRGIEALSAHLQGTLS